MALFTLLSLLTSAPIEGVALAADSPDAKAAASERFKRGVAAFDDKRFADAAIEFEAAYALSPSFRVLYNIGQVNAALGRSVEAVVAYERYLEEGGSTISADRRREVRREIEKQSGRIGRVTVRMQQNGVDVRIDGDLVGQTPLVASVKLTSGRHVVQGFIGGRASDPRAIDLCGACDVVVDLEIPAQALPAPAPPPPVPPPALASSPPSPPPSSPPTPAPAAPKAGTEVAEARPGRWQRITGLAAMAVGLGVATAGGVTALVGADRAGDARDRLARATTGAEWDAAKPDFDAGKRLNQRGWIVAACGSAVLVGGIVLVATSPQRSGEVALRPWLTAGSGGALLAARW